MDTKQPDALRLADTLDLLAMDLKTPRLAAFELRRQHAEIETLRKRCLHQIGEPAQPVGAAPVGIVAASPGYVGVGWIGGYVPKHNDKLYAAPQPAAQALDAIRYQFLRDGEWRDTDLEPFIRLQLNTLLDAKIDAAIAAQQGAAT